MNFKKLFCIIFLLSSLLYSCGIKGPPLPPLAEEEKKIKKIEEPAPQSPTMTDEKKQIVKKKK